MNRVFREFVSKEERQFPVRVGTHVASSLSGFLAGAVVASIVWLAGTILLRLFFPNFF